MCNGTEFVGQGKKPVAREQIGSVQNHFILYSLCAVAQGTVQKLQIPGQGGRVVMLVPPIPFWISFPPLTAFSLLPRTQVLPHCSSLLTFLHETDRFWQDTGSQISRCRLGKDFRQAADYCSCKLTFCSARHPLC